MTYLKIMQPQRKDLIEKHEDKYGSEANTLLFTGPFKISEWIHNRKIEMTEFSQQNYNQVLGVNVNVDFVE